MVYSYGDACLNEKLGFVMNLSFFIRPEIP